MDIFVVNKLMMKVNRLKTFHFDCYYPVTTCLKCAFDTLQYIYLSINIWFFQVSIKFCLHNLSRSFFFNSFVSG